MGFHSVMGTTMSSGSLPTRGTLTTPAGRTFRISAPTVGSKLTSQISPRAGSLIVERRVHYIPDQFRVASIELRSTSHLRFQYAVALLKRQQHQLLCRPPPWASQLGDVNEDFLSFALGQRFDLFRDDFDSTHTSKLLFR